MWESNVKWNHHNNVFNRAYTVYNSSTDSTTLMHASDTTHVEISLLGFIH